MQMQTSLSPSPSRHSAPRYYYGGVSYPSQRQQPSATCSLASCLCLPITVPVPISTSLSASETARYPPETAGAAAVGGRVPDGSSDIEMNRWRGIKRHASLSATGGTGDSDLESDRLSEVLNTDIRELMTRLKSGTEPSAVHEEAKEPSTRSRLHRHQIPTGKHTYSTREYIHTHNHILSLLSHINPT
jgi:hypothetical protein